DAPRVARIVRGSVLVIRETTYVEAARALGVSDLVIVTRHVLPNCLSPVIVQASFVFAAAVLTEAALSFLGVGVPPYVPSWGNILAEGRLYLQQAPWLVLYPGAAIMLTLFGLNLLGDGLRHLLDPRLRGAGRRRRGLHGGRPGGRAEVVRDARQPRRLAGRPRALRHHGPRARAGSGHRPRRARGAADVQERRVLRGGARDPRPVEGGRAALPRQRRAARGRRGDLQGARGDVPPGRRGRRRGFLPRADRGGQ